MDLVGYQLEMLSDRGELSLYRARHRDSESSVLVVLAEQATPSVRARLDREFIYAGALAPGLTNRPLALIDHEGGRALVLEDMGNEPLDRLLTGPLAPARFLELAIALARSLGQLHKEGIIHKDIKPANILVDLTSGDVRLTGFGIAARVIQDRHEPFPSTVIEGTLAYMAPEQTGFMNRSVDPRSDLYSLGVVLYEMLVGALPFTTSDPLELVHCHMARTAVAPGERVPMVPAQLSRIVMKLLSKTAEDRYQHAEGLRSDLASCLEQWTSQGHIEPFALGARDDVGRLTSPKSLYGRHHEIEAIHNAFDRVAACGTVELVLVSGRAGVGKSSIGEALHRLLPPTAALFAAGEADHGKQDIPYAALAQALRSLVRQILVRSDIDMAQWREAFCEALGPHGQLIVNLVPELEFAIGAQASSPELPPQSQQHRFQVVVQRFLAVFARPERPLVLFLDDLQWLEPASFDLIQHVMTQPGFCHVLLIGTYRDNEVSVSHPLTQMVAAIRRGGVLVSEIALGSLDEGDTGRLVADSLRCSPELTQPLARMLHEKTGGNPFFLNQFLFALADEHLLAFDPVSMTWRWDLRRIQEKKYTDNVADLIAATIGCLDPDTRDVLSKLACLWRVVSTRTLVLVCGGSAVRVRGALQEALQRRLVVRQKDGYAFAHDRVHEAVYALIPHDARARMHAQIGRLLMSAPGQVETDDRVFEILSQFNRSTSSINTWDELRHVAELNLVAGRRAKKASAHASAAAYFSTGRALLPDDAWRWDYALTFALELGLAECEYLTGERVLSEKRLLFLSAYARTVEDSAEVAYLRLNLYTTEGRSDEAVAVGLDFLHRAGMEWNESASEKVVAREYARLRALASTHSVETLRDRPLMTDSARRATMEVLAALVSPALHTDANIFRLVIAYMVNLSLEYGNCDASCLGYVWFGSLLGASFGDYAEGFRFGKLGVELAREHGFERFNARVQLVFGNLVAIWTRPLSESRLFLRCAFDAAQSAADLSHANHSRSALITNLLACGEPLGEIQKEAEDGLGFVQQARFGLVIDCFTVHLALIRALRGATHDLASLKDGTLINDDFERRLQGNPSLTIAACWYWVRQLQLCVLANDPVAARAATARAEPLLWSSASHWVLAEFHFYAALAVAAGCDPASAASRVTTLVELKRRHAHLLVWAANCPENFDSWSALIAGEIARLEGRDLDAMHGYEESIRHAHRQKQVQNEGIASEVAARFYVDRGFTEVGATYLRMSRQCYVRWGADGKVKQLDRRFPFLNGPRAPMMPAYTLDVSLNELDAGAMFKAAQALSSEIVLDSLIQTLVRMVIEHAGAERGLLILLRNGEPQIAARASVDGQEIAVERCRASIKCQDLPRSVLHYVIRTGENVILDNASESVLFADDKYLRAGTVRSLLCLPILKQGGVVGTLYLENNLTPRVFTSERIRVLEFLASQAAISLENAYLYADLQRSEAFLAEGQRMSHTGSWHWNVRTGKLVWSAEHYRIFGLDPSEHSSLMFDHFIERVCAEDRPVVHQHIKTSVESKAGFALDFRIVLQDGGTKYLHCAGHPVANKDDGAAEFIGTTMDLTPRKAAEDALQAAQAELARSARLGAMGELLASIVHEVSQPIGAIGTAASAALHWLSRPEANLVEAREMLVGILEGSARVGELIRGLRALAQKAPPKFEAFDINEAIREVLAFSTSQIRNGGVEVDERLIVGARAVIADRVLIQQVVLNLVANAIEAMSGLGGRRKLLRVSTRLAASDDVVVAVEDSVGGLEPEDIDRIFEPFVTTKVSGMGMGLSICRSIVEAHGGTISVSPSPGLGTIFWFTVPTRGRPEFH